MAKLNPNQISIFLPIATETLFSANPVFGDIERCEWDFSEYRYATSSRASVLHALTDAIFAHTEISTILPSLTEP